MLLSHVNHFFSQFFFAFFFSVLLQFLEEICVSLRIRVDDDLELRQIMFQLLNVSFQSFLLYVPGIRELVLRADNMERLDSAMKECFE